MSPFLFLFIKNFNNIFGFMWIYALEKFSF